MANIALVTASTSHNAYNATKVALEASGHIVTGFNMSDVTSSNLAAFDVIACVRCSTSDGAYSTFAVHLQGYQDAGRPILVGYDHATGTGTTATSLAVSIGLAQRVVSKNNAGTTIYASQQHPVWTETGVIPPVAVSVLNSQTYGMTIDPTGLRAGTTIATQSEADTAPVVQVAQGGEQLIGKMALAKVAFAGFMYGGSAYHPTGISLLNSLVEWLVSQPAKIVGTVKDEAGAPLERRVLAYLRETGQLQGYTTSDPVTGAFTIDVQVPDSHHFVVTLDEDGGTENALIRDRVTPFLA